MSSRRRRPKSAVFTRYPSRRSFIEGLVEDDFFMDDEIEDDDGQKNLTMKDKDEMLQELKKENFDLKLRLYMTQKNSENAEGKVGEYEQQLAALLNSLEEQQQLSEQQTRELEDARQREKLLLYEQKKLESQCKEQDEKIHNLSLNLSKLSKSMHDVSVNQPAHSSTPLRNAKSAYIPDDGSASEGEGDHEVGGVRPFNNVNISHVTPMRRDAPTSTSSSQGERANLVDSDHGVHLSFSEGTRYLVNNTPGGGTPQSTKNYHFHNNSTNNTSNFDSLSGRPDYAQQADNVGVVRPNNTRTVVDVEIPPEPIVEKNMPNKKKKKGIMKVFKLCTGKSGQSVDQKRDEMYVKREPARVQMTTYTNESLN